MLINVSNHPSTVWSESQLQAANKYGPVKDIPFPTVSPDTTHEQVVTMANELSQKIVSEFSNQIDAVHVMGEFTLCYALVSLFKKANITCVASTTERNVTCNPDGTKTSTFCFVQFREY